VLALGPGLRPGYLLAYDMVFVPAPPFPATMFGPTGALAAQARLLPGCTLAYAQGIVVCRMR
jgi:hypothetical protein